MTEWSVRRLKLSPNHYWMEYVLQTIRESQSRENETAITAMTDKVIDSDNHGKQSIANFVRYFGPVRCLGSIYASLLFRGSALLCYIPVL